MTLAILRPVHLAAEGGQLELLPKIAIDDCGSQYTLVIERIARELGVRTMVLDSKRMAKLLKSKPDLRAIILSGGGRSVFEQNAPKPPKELFELLRTDGTRVPVLGICYGMQ